MLRRESIVLLLASAVLTTAGLAKAQSPRSYVPPNGFVPDEATAALMAEAVWIPIYGESKIASEKPFKIKLNGDVWTVTGKDLPSGWAGGVAEADITYSDTS